MNLSDLDNFPQYYIKDLQGAEKWSVWQ